MSDSVSLEMLPDPITPPEVAAALRIVRSTVFDLLRRGAIRHLRVGTSRRARILIYKADLIAWIEASKTGTSIH